MTPPNQDHPFVKALHDQARMTYALSGHRAQDFDHQKYISIEDYVLDRGRIYEPAPLTTLEAEIVEAARRRAGEKFGNEFEPKMCFMNALHLVLADESGCLSYCEGLGQSVFPMVHAWAVIRPEGWDDDSEGKVVDLTWKGQDTGRPILGDFGEDRAYMGVEFQTEFVMSTVAKNEIHTSIIEFWPGGLMHVEKRQGDFPSEWERAREAFRALDSLRGKADSLRRKGVSS